MGVRSFFTTNSDATRWPGWFREKWGDAVVFPAHIGPISSRSGAKSYIPGEGWSGLCEDIHRALFVAPEPGGDPWRGDLFVAFVDRHGDLIRARIDRDGVTYEEPDSQMDRIGSLEAGGSPMA